MIADSKRQVFRVFLSELQSAQFQTVLAEAQDRTGVSGIFCTVRRTFDLDNNRIGLELQVGWLSKDATRKIQRILAEEQALASQPAGDPAPAGGRNSMSPM